MNSGRGWHSHFFVFKDLGLSLAPKMCPDQSQAFKEVNNGQALTAGRKKKGIVFPNEALPVAPRRVCTKFHANIRRTDCIGPILSQTYARDRIYTWNQVSTMPSREFCTLRHKSPNVHAVSVIDPETLHTCLMYPCRAFCGWFFFCFVLFCFRWKCGIP